MAEERGDKAEFLVLVLIISRIDLDHVALNYSTPSCHVDLETFFQVLGHVTKALP